MMLFIAGMFNRSPWFHINQSEYSATVLTDILHQVLPYYILRPPNSTHISLKVDDETIVEPYHSNLSQYISIYRMRHNTSNYTSQYLYATYHYIEGVRNLFGINQSRNQIQGLMHFEVAQRYGCNEATTLLAQMHKNGVFGLAKSPAIAFNYYQELFQSWASGITGKHIYQYNHNKHYIDLKMGYGSDGKEFSKSEIQHMILDVLENKNERILYGNMLASGFLTNQFGIEIDDKMAARFAFLSASTPFKIKIDEKLNSLEAIIKYKGKQEDHTLARLIEIDKTDEQNQQQETNKITVILNKLKTAAKWLLSKQDEDQFENDDDDEVNRAMYSTYKPPGDLKEQLNQYIEDFNAEGINLLNFNQIVPLTADAFYDSLLKLAREVSWKIYEEYGYFKLFDGLSKDESNKPTKDEVFDLLLYANSSLIYNAVRMFIDNTDREANLVMLRNSNDIVNKGYDAYYNNIKQATQTQRSMHETCTRHGQSFGLLSYALKKQILTPQVVSDSNMNINIGRIMSLGAAYYGCHMGLTSLSFLALEGYYPYKNPELNQTTLLPMNISGKNKTVTNSLHLRPEPKQALMGLDIASQAGSFESSFHEALLLSHRIYNFSANFKQEIQFYYTQQFNDVGYQDIAEFPQLARMLAEHSANAGHLGGVFLSGLFQFNGYGTNGKHVATGLARMKRAAQIITVDEIFDEVTQYLVNPDQRFASYFIQALAGDHISLTNLFRYINDASGYNGTICFNTRSKQFCFNGKEAYELLLLEIGANLGDDNPSVVQEMQQFCSKNTTRCMIALHGFDVNQTVNDNKIDNQKKQIQYLRNDLTHNGEYNESLLLLVKDFNNNYVKPFTQRYIEFTTKLLKAKTQSTLVDHKAMLEQHQYKFQSPEELKQAIQNKTMLTANQLSINKLKTNSRYSKFAQLVHNCFYEENITYNQFIHQYYSKCLLIKNLLVHQSGQLQRQIYQLTTNEKVLSQDTQFYAVENTHYLNNIVINLIWKAPDLYLAQLLDFNLDFMHKYCKTTQIDNQLNQNIFEIFQIKNVLQLLNQSQEYKLEDLHDLKDLLNNNVIPEQFDSSINNKSIAGILAPKYGASRELFDFCANPLQEKKHKVHIPQTIVYISTLNTQIILQIYLFFECHLSFIIFIILVVIVFVFSDCFVRKRYGKTDIGDDDLQDQEIPNQENNKQDDDQKNDVEENDEFDLNAFKGGLEGEVGK